MPNSPIVASSAKIVSHNTLRSKLRRLEEKTKAQVWRWSLQWSPGQEPFIRAWLMRDSIVLDEPTDLTLTQILAYEDDELLMFGSYRDPLDTGAVEQDV